jgi:hypothetical protein
MSPRTSETLETHRTTKKRIRTSRTLRINRHHRTTAHIISTSRISISYVLKVETFKTSNYPQNSTISIKNRTIIENLWTSRDPINDIPIGQMSRTSQELMNEKQTTKSTNLNQIHEPKTSLNTITDSPVTQISRARRRQKPSKTIAQGHDRDDLAQASRISRAPNIPGSITQSAKTPRVIKKSSDHKIKGICTQANEALRPKN